MKRILALVLSLIVVVSLFGCTSGEKNMSTDDSTIGDVKETVFEQFESRLTKEGIRYEKVSMAADLIGAKEGAKYKIGEGSVELYLFDESSDAYVNAEKKQAVTLEDFGDIDAMVADGMALMVSGLDAQLYNEIFKSVIK